MKIAQIHHVRHLILMSIFLFAAFSSFSQTSSSKSKASADVAPARQDANAAATKKSPDVVKPAPSASPSQAGSAKPNSTSGGASTTDNPQAAKPTQVVYRLPSNGSELLPKKQEGSKRPAKPQITSSYK